MLKTVFIKAVLVMGLSLGLVGCVVSHTNFTSQAIPQRSFLVGGGFNIEYMALTNGIAYWVEETSQKILATRSMQRDDNVEFDGDPDALADTLGIPKERIKLTLYFIPNPPTSDSL